MSTDLLEPPQTVEERARVLVAADRERRGTLKAVAEAHGLKRSSLSAFMNGSWTGRTDLYAEQIVEALSGRVTCPHLNTDIQRQTCREQAAKPMPLSDPRALRHWQACRECPHSKGDGRC